MEWEFISLASHQMRTPLSAVKWFTEILLSGDLGKLNTKQRDFVEMISSSNARMIHLIDLLLKLSRIETGRVTIDPRPTDLSKLFQDVIFEFENQIKMKKLELKLKLNQDLPKIKIDPTLFHEAYVNLISNSIKFNRIGGKIEVVITRKGNEIFSSVSDAGYGIPRAEQHKVFQRFFRAKNVGAGSEEGSGLGLYLVKRIIDIAGGRIGFESQEGKGSTFWFTLPISGQKPKKGEVSLVR